MIALGNGLVNARGVFDLVAFENGDLIEVIRENAGGYESGNAPTDNDRVPSQIRHRSPLPVLTVQLRCRRQKGVIDWIC